MGWLSWTQQTIDLQEQQTRHRPFPRVRRSILLQARPANPEWCRAENAKFNVCPYSIINSRVDEALQKLESIWINWVGSSFAETPPTIRTTNKQNKQA
jgi:small-conductance mechanosensitive channel